MSSRVRIMLQDFANGTCWTGHQAFLALDGLFNNYVRQLSMLAKPPLEVPPGPRWQMALAMWEQMTSTLGNSYRFFVCRDNRKQDWRRSLCNPFFQGYGYRAHAKAKAVKKPKADVRTNTTYARAPRPGEDQWLERTLEQAAAERDRQVRTWGNGGLQVGQAGNAIPAGGREAQPPKRPKPRVGIWG